MSVSIRKKYLGKERAKRKRDYKYQLDYKIGGKRKRETIKEVTFYSTDTHKEKKDKERIVNRIKANLEIELGNLKNGLTSNKYKKTNFLLYFKNIGESQSKNTKATWASTLKLLHDYQGRSIKFEEIDITWLEGFISFMQKRELEDNSVITYFNKVNAALNQAVRDNILNTNPGKSVRRLKKKETNIVFLTRDEIQRIIETNFWDNEVKNAFLFSCYTGLRVSDIQKLKWENISDEWINIIQTKTKNSVYVPLNNNAKMILEKQKHNECNIFKLSPYHSSVNRTLKKLIKKTDIEKNIHFHCGRHTFATLLVSSGVDIYVISKILGHKDIKSTKVYAKVVNSEKIRAVNKIKIFKN